jgi:hypothetical protein
MKKEVAGRYPRHPWPDDPKTWWLTNKKISQTANKKE